MLLRLGLVLSSAYLMAWLWSAAGAQFSGTILTRSSGRAVLAQAYYPPVNTPPAYQPQVATPPSAAPPPPPVINPPVYQTPTWESPTYYPSTNYPTTYYR